MSLTQAEQDAIAYLRTPAAIRDRCEQLFALACEGKLEHFAVDLSQLDATAEYVLKVIQASYPELQVPFHSRWRHLEVGGRSREERFAQLLVALDPIEQARTRVDWVVVSVLLDAGAGSEWRFTEPSSGLVIGRSEGLAIASFELFLQGGFSGDLNRPYQVDADGLEQFTEATLIEGFQVRDDNPLVGVSGRVSLLQQLGRALRQHPDLFGAETPRPGHLVDYLLAQSTGDRLDARLVLQAVLTGLGNICPGWVAIAGANLGDVWPHSALMSPELGGNLVPFHKLSQWLTYSLLEPLQTLGLTITHLDGLTGLSEYRNGGLFVDLGVLQPRYAEVLTVPHRPASEVIVEWRALTLCLLDRVAIALRERLGLSAEELPLVKVLEGGTWAAGRKIAAEKRSNGAPPIQIESDGTVF